MPGNPAYYLSLLYFHSEQNGLSPSIRRHPVSLFSHDIPETFCDGRTLLYLLSLLHRSNNQCHNPNIRPLNSYYREIDKL